MDLIQYKREDFYNVKETYELTDEEYDNYEEILNIINSQLFQNSKYQGTKSGKDWRKKKLPSFLDRTVSDADKLKNSINLELNKLSGENYKNILDTIKNIMIDIPDDKYTEITSLIVDSVFEKAVIQPHFCPHYVKLVLSIVDNDNKTVIMTLLRNKCTTYHQILTKKIDGDDIEKVSSINNQNTQTEVSDDSSDYDEMCKNNLRKQYKRGFSQFVGELYNYDIITSREILFFCKKMLSNILNDLTSKNIDEDFIEDNIIYFHKLLEISIKRLMDRQRRNMNPLYQIIKLIDELINHKNISKISSRLKFKLKDCHDIVKIATKKDRHRR